MDNGIIALLTDFGLYDNYIGVVKGVMAGINPSALLIDLCHNVESFSILNGQYHLYATYRYFPSGTIFYVVIDPGVGSDRKGLIVQDENYIFVLPDNGLISAVDLKPGMCEVFEINISQYPSVSSTFHGRDVFAQVAAKLAKGEKAHNLGKKIDSYIQKNFPHFIVRNNEIGSEIVHIDVFGNVITAIPNNKIVLSDKNLVSFNHESKGHAFKLCKTYGDLHLAEYGVLYGSSGLIEMAMNQNSIAEEFQLNIGDRIILQSE